MAVSGDDDVAGRRSFGNAGYDELLGADDDWGIDIPESDFRAAEFAWTQTMSGDAHLTARKRTLRLDRIDVRIAVDAQCSHDCR
jgi:hypothetical protein